MLLETDPEPEPVGPHLVVGQDEAGHWLVQDSGGRMEGRFISLAAAMTFARAEQHRFPGARIVKVERRLIPQVSFAPAAPWETALARAA